MLDPSILYLGPLLALAALLLIAIPKTRPQVLLRTLIVTATATALPIAIYHIHPGYDTAILAILSKALSFPLCLFVSIGYLLPYCEQRLPKLTALPGILLFAASVADFITLRQVRLP